MGAHGKLIIVDFGSTILQGAIHSRGLSWKSALRQFPTLVCLDATTLLVTVLSKKFGNDVKRRECRMCEEDPSSTISR